MENKKTSLVFGILMVLVLTLTTVLAHAGEEESGGCFGGMMSGSWGIGGMFFGWLFGVLVIVALVLLIFWLIKQIQKK